MAPPNSVLVLFPWDTVYPGAMTFFTILSFTNLSFTIMDRSLAGLNEALESPYFHSAK
jgi:hypothetical protein